MNPILEAVAGGFAIAGAWHLAISSALIAWADVLLDLSE
ncbi:hypothetical protein QFZ96_004395 [Paraburkholderia youngii]